MYNVRLNNASHWFVSVAKSSYRLCLLVLRGVARIFGLGEGGRPCHVEPDPASIEVAKSMPGVRSGSSPRRILRIRMPEMHFPSIWHHHHNLSNHEV